MRVYVERAECRLEYVFIVGVKINEASKARVQNRTGIRDDEVDRAQDAEPSKVQRAS